MAAERRIIDTDIAEMKITLKEIFTILNGPEGLVTKVALHEHQMKNLPSPTTLKFYASIGGGVVLTLGMIGYSVIKLFTGAQQ